MTVPFNFATQSGNIPLSELDANFANVSAHTLTATYVTGNNQPNITGIGSLNSLSVYGNVGAGNISTNGIIRSNVVSGANYVGTNVSVVGNITGNNIIANNSIEFGNISANGNLSGGNVLSSGLISAVGNILGGNLSADNLSISNIYSDNSTYVTVEDGLEIHGELLSESLEVAGNSIMNNLTVTGNFIGVDINVNSIKNGSSNVDITNSNGNVTVGVNGVNNVLVVTSTGVVVAGTIEATDLVVGNISSDGSTAITISDNLSVHGDIDTIGDISATSNVTGGNLSATSNVTGGNLSATGNVLTGGLLTDNYYYANGIPVIFGYGNLNVVDLMANFGSNSISTTGNVTSGNILTTGAISATGIANVGQLLTSGTVSAVGNGVFGGNVVSSGLITATGNVNGGNLVTGGNVTGGNLVTGGNISASGNVTGGNISASGNVTGGNLVIPNNGKILGNFTNNPATGDRTLFQTSVGNGATNITAVPNGTGTSSGFVGYNSSDVANISGVSLIAGSANVTLRSFKNGTASYVPLVIETGGATRVTVDINGNVGIANTAPVDTLSVGGNAFVTGIKTDNYYYANGTPVSFAGTYGNANVAVFMNNFGSNSISTTGNIDGANIRTQGTVSALGNIITTGYFVGNFNGNISGNFTVPGSNTQVLYNANGNASAVAGFTYNTDSNTMTVLGVVSAQGNVIAGNVTTVGQVSATGNVTGENLVIPNNGKILGDFTNNPVTGGRTLFQTSVGNGATNITAVPAGTGTTSGFVGYNSSDVANVGGVSLIAGPANVTIRSFKFGTASYVPLLIETGGATRVTFDINGNVGIGNTTPVDTFSVGGNAYISGNVTGGNLVTGGNISATGDVTSGNISASGNVTGENLVIPNNGKILGDFTNNPASGGRTLFQTSVGNGATNITAVPNGTGTSSGFVGYNSSDVANISGVSLFATPASVTLRSFKFGTASYIPVVIETGGATRVTFDINGNVGIGNTTPVDTLSVGGNAYISGNVTGGNLAATNLVINHISSDDSAYVVVDDGLAVQGSIDVSGDILTTSKVTTLPTALANLTAVAGARAFINDANLVAASNFGTLVGSGGSNVVPVWSDGTNWYIG